MAASHWARFGSGSSQMRAELRSRSRCAPCLLRVAVDDRERLEDAVAALRRELADAEGGLCGSTSRNVASRSETAPAGGQGLDEEGDGVGHDPMLRAPEHE